MIFEIISGGEKTDWVGKEWAGLFFPRGKNGPAHSFPGEKTDWGEIPACYTGIQNEKGHCLPAPDYASWTVKPVLSGHSKKRPKLGFL